MLKNAIVIDETSDLSALLDLLQTSKKDIVISRNGNPVAHLMPYNYQKPRIGAAKGKLNFPNDIDFCNDEIADLFYSQRENTREFIH